MRKTILILAVLVLAAGCGAKNQIRDQGSAVPENKQEDKGIFASIKDAIDRSMSLKCEYADEDGQLSITYIKGREIAFESMPQDKEESKTYGIARDNKMWVWAADSKVGLLIDFSKDIKNPSKMEDKEIRSTDDIISVIESHKDKCQTATVEASRFELPKDVEFNELNF